MPKARSLILSSISGKLKGGPTFRANPQTDAITLQTASKPTDRRTPKQLAIRAAYSRLAYLWNHIPNLDREPYQIIAEENRITPWNAYLKFFMPMMKQTPYFYFPFSEGTGITTQNYGISGKTATIDGAAWTEIGTRNALSFDGDTAHLHYDHETPIEITPPFTTYLLFSNYEIPQDFRLIATGFSLPDDATTFNLYTYEGKIMFESYHYGEHWCLLETLDPVTLPPSGSLAIVSNNEESKIYLNGQLLNCLSSDIDLGFRFNTLSIFGDPPTWTSSALDCSLFAILPSALTAEEIANMDALYMS